MDPISQSAIPVTDIPAYEPPVPQQPDASDIQEFQSLYGQDSAYLVEKPGVEGFQKLLTRMMGDSLNATPGDNIFTAAMSRMAETHQVGVSKLETLLDRISSSTNMSPEDLIEAQILVQEVTQGMGTYQAVEKKLQEGIKALMTGQ